MLSGKSGDDIDNFFCILSDFTKIIKTKICIPVFLASHSYQFDLKKNVLYFVKSRGWAIGCNFSKSGVGDITGVSIIADN